CSRVPGLAGGGASTAFTSVGPANLAGRVSSIAPSPTAGTIYVGTADGGVWKTIDSGANWNPLTDDWSDLSVGAVAVAPSSPNTIYVGTGEGFSNFFAIPGIGVMKSTDGTNFSLASSAPGASRYYKMLVNPSDANDVVIGANNGVFRTLNGFA